MSEELQKAQVRITAMQAAVALYCCLSSQGNIGSVPVPDNPTSYQEGIRPQLEYLFKDLMKLAGVADLV